MTGRESTPARPFLKWAGGKGQLLEQFEPLFPKELENGTLTTYVEPFIGAGAVFFHVAARYPHIKKAYLYDINDELVRTYRVIKSRRWVEVLIGMLDAMVGAYLPAAPEQRKKQFYQIRERYNRTKPDIQYERRLNEAAAERVAQLIFLNKTCYNGLFRTNSSGGFNVPFGRYKNPRMFSADNLRRVSATLRRVRAEIRCADFESCAPHIDRRTFVYFDPPYRPISTTSNFTTYSRGGFNDDQQTRLGHFFARLDRETGARLMLSNSDPCNLDPQDRFFEDLFQGYTLERVFAARSINSHAGRRGAISELVVTNYPRA